MGIVHFLDVGQGDCSIIQHASGRVTVIDVCKARSTEPFEGLLAALMPTNYPARRGSTLLTGGLAEFAAAANPAPLGFGLAEALRQGERENPIEYMQQRGINEIFRFVLTHPDMDHMDGIKDLFETFEPENFWDTANTCAKTFTILSPFREEDWDFYRGMRDGTAPGDTKRLTLYSGARGAFYNEAGVGEVQDGLYVLAPTTALVAQANWTEDFNDASYVILYRSRAGRVLFCGDAHDGTWDHILANHLAEVQGVELMVAPHHGRDSNRKRDFLDAVRPRLTLFGYAPSQHLAYDAWRNRGLHYITCNASGTVVVDTNGERMQVYVAKKACASEYNSQTVYVAGRGWYCGWIEP